MPFPPKHPPSPEILSLRAQNSTQPISRLPNEILALIFQSHRDIHSFDLHQDFVREIQSPWDSKPQSTLLPFLYVCYSWRSTAKRCPRVWTKIDFGMYSLRTCKRMVKASKGLPLDILIRPRPEYRVGGIWGDVETQVLDVVEPLIPRIRSVLAELHNHSFLAFFSKLHEFHSTASGTLRELYLIATGRRENYRFPVVDWSKFSALKVLRITGITVDWASDCYGNHSITHLSLDTNKVERITQSYSDVISYITSFPSLVSLKLSPGIFRENHTTVGPTTNKAIEPILIQHLRKIDIKGCHFPLTLPIFLSLINRLSIPHRDMTWLIGLHYEDKPPFSPSSYIIPNPRPSFTELADLLISTTSVRDIAVWIKNDSSIFLGGANGRGSDHSFVVYLSVDYRAHSSVAPGGKKTEHPQEKIIRDATLDAFSRYPGIETLSYRDDRDFPAVSVPPRERDAMQVERWRNFFRKQPGLTELKIRSRTLPEIIDAFAPLGVLALENTDSDRCPLERASSELKSHLLAPFLSSLNITFALDAPFIPSTTGLVPLFNYLKTSNSEFSMTVTCASSHTRNNNVDDEDDEDDEDDDDEGEDGYDIHWERSFLALLGELDDGDESRDEDSDDESEGFIGEVEVVECGVLRWYEGQDREWEDPHWESRFLCY